MENHTQPSHPANPQNHTGETKVIQGKIIFAWIILLAYVSFILLTLSTVPLWREYLQKRYGEGIFAIITYAAAALFISNLLNFMIFSRREKRVSPYLSLIIILFALFYVMRHWIFIPVEQIHFIEYGLVGVLAYNALRHHLKGWGLALAALLLTYFCGMVDECLQGNLANRVGEQRDMLWNGLAGLLGLSLVTFTWRPDRLRGRSGRNELIAALLIIVAVLPLQGYFNSHIAQFGYLIEDEGREVTFRSRLPLDQLKTYNDRLDHFQMEIIPRMGKVRQPELLPQVHDRIHEEAFVHIFRRAVHYLNRSYIVAYKENVIIQSYYRQFVQGTEQDWPPAMAGKLQEKIGDISLAMYHSPVAEHLITRFTERQMWIVIVLLEVVLWGAIAAMVFKKRAASS